MEYLKTINDLYITSLHITDAGGNCDENEYFALLDKINSKPAAPDGYTNKLRADTLEWELVELPEPENEPTAESTPAWDISQGEYIPEGFLLTRDGVTYECIVGHYAAWNKQPPHAEYWKEV